MPVGSQMATGLSLALRPFKQFGLEVLAGALVQEFVSLDAC